MHVPIDVSGVQVAPITALPWLDGVLENLAELAVRRVSGPHAAPITLALRINDVDRQMGIAKQIVTSFQNAPLPAHLSWLSPALRLDNVHTGGVAARGRGARSPRSR
ncbi:hypothetical protein [Mycolicibacterium agri]|uniref:Uncharacterized protein n=1 Tax=Mycolicibacterium agri TaxID=36811 RepID=A0A7I9WBT9_MYCAG|nr:hypothetical protein MAGR_66340 [Mycolicibacterium agri]